MQGKKAREKMLRRRKMLPKNRECKHCGKVVFEAARWVIKSWKRSDGQTRIFIGCRSCYFKSRAVIKGNERVKKIPDDRVCPHCLQHKPNVTHQWVVVTAFVGCRKCWLARDGD